MAAHAGIDLVDLADEAVRRDPFHHRVRFQKSPIDSLRRSTKYAMQPNGVAGLGHVSFLQDIKGKRHSIGQTASRETASARSARNERSEILSLDAVLDEVHRRLGGPHMRSLVVDCQFVDEELGNAEALTTELGNGRCFPESALEERTHGFQHP